VEVLQAFRAVQTQSSDRNLVVDILVDNEDAKRTLFVGDWIDSSSTHGTGCTLSAALASALASRVSDPSCETSHYAAIVHADEN
jgi:hydroxymethylpyrimidine/phosphomethylpyrimidine kinase